MGLYKLLKVFYPSEFPWELLPVYQTSLPEFGHKTIVLSP